ncbi:MAG: SH3-like domain-containing protein [Pseudomonadota bacterium]
MSDTLAPVALPAVAPPYPAGAPRFAPGDAVRVRAGRAPGHLRTPWYLRGRVGRVERVCGAFANPEELAYHRAGTPEQPLYRVRFTMAAVWGEAAERPADTLDAEIYEHWLEPDHAA